MIPEPKEFAKKVVETTLNGEAKQFTNSTQYTDTTNAEAICNSFGDVIRFDHKRGRWLVWDKNIWRPDADGEINRYAIYSTRRQYRNAEDITDLNERTKASRWAIQSESKVRLDAATGILKNLIPVADRGDNWDTNNMLLACPNGVVELASGEIRPGRPEDRITMQTNVEFDKEAECPRWLKFIDEIFLGDAELIHFIQKALGYTITGSTSEQVAFFCYGGGSNGKGVFFKTIRDVLGDYAYDAPATLFQRNALNTNTNDVAATEGKRFLISSETLSTSKLNEQRLKGWTGGDKVTARYLYSEFTSFEPTVKPWLFVNHKPQVEDDSYGFWRRVRLIPFNARFVIGQNADTTLADKLKEEYPGILKWLIEACLTWQEEGLQPVPASVVSATKDYQIENDALSEFIFDKCEEGNELSVKSSELYKAYVAWTDEQGYGVKDKLSITAFGRRMGDKYLRRSTRQGKFYTGIALKSQIGDGFEDPASLDVTGLTPFLVKSSHENNIKQFTKNDPQLFTQARKLSTNPSQDDDNEYIGEEIEAL